MSVDNNNMPFLV